MARLKRKNIKAVGEYNASDDIFWMDLNEAKRAIADKYEYYQDKYERRFPKRNPA